MARKQHHNSISLFPFLAVLVCAMGALILLLLVMTRKIRHDQAERASTAEAIAEMKAAPDLTEDLQKLQSEIDQLLAANTLLQSETEEIQSTIVADEHRKADLLRRLNQLQAELELARDDAKDRELAESVRSVRDLTQQEKELLAVLDSIEKSLLEKRSRLTTLSLSKERTAVALSQKHSALISLRKAIDKAESAPPATGTVTMLEFSNPTGTARTPIVIEITDKGYEFRPTGVLITPAELDNFPVRDNPLLAGVLSAHRHRVGASMTDEPYVLLLVRPSGCLNFYRAQHILNDTKVHFGYELIEAERSFAVGEPDAKEAAKTQEAIAEALRRREKIYGKLIAIMEQERGVRSGRKSTDEASPKRRLVVRPDGRVLDEQDVVDRPLDGRFYAGGEAPPQGYLNKRPSGGFKPRAEGQLSADEAEKMVEDFAKQYSQQLAGEPTASPNDPPSKISGDDREKVPVTALADAVPQPSGMAGRKPLQQPAVATSPDETASPVIGSQSFDEFVAAADKSSTTSGSGKSNELSRQKTAVGSFQGDRFLQSHQGGSSENPKDHSVVTQEKLNAQSKRSMSDGTLSAGAENSNETASESASGDQSVDDIVAASQKKPDLSRIDPDLLKRLESGKGKSSNSSSMATPVGITVYLDERHMTVGQMPAMELSQDNMAMAFTRLLEGVDQEVKDQKLRPDEPVMPIVKFVVSPGGEQWRVRLTPMLRHIGLHSAAVFELTPYMMPVDESDTTGRASFASHSAGGN